MKNILSITLILILLFNVTSCQNDSVDITKKNETVAYTYSSGSLFAVKEFLNEGATAIEYNSPSDVVLAVENGKADSGVIDEFELNEFLDADRKIVSRKVCNYSTAYCAYFSGNNADLRKAFNDAIKHLEENGVLDSVKEAHYHNKDYKRTSPKTENGTITMLCDSSFDKRVFVDKNGETKGLDVDVAYEICNFLGYELEIVTADFDELFYMLDNGEGDFIITSAEITEERKKHYYASEPYFILNYHLIERD